MQNLKIIWVLAIGAVISILIFSLMAKKIDLLKQKLHDCEFQKQNLVSSIHEQNKQIEALKLDVKDYNIKLSNKKQEIITKIQAVPQPKAHNECEATLKYIIELQELE